MVLLRFSCGFPIVFFSFFLGVLVVLLWFSFGFPMFSYGFAIVLHSFAMFSLGSFSPVVFLRFSCGFP